MAFHKVDAAALDELERIVGQSRLILDPEKLAAYSHDEFSLQDIAREPEVVVKPESAGQVSEILRLANELRIPVTPRGGATGLAGGCVPSLGGIVLSLEGLNRIIEIDAANQMAVVEAGVTLKDFTCAVEQAGFSFPPHPGDESAMIGGLIATNAGGSRAVKYGGIRSYVRGLEVVLADGRVIRPGGKLIKSSTGYNLVHLFIGSEGTLGVITRATLQVLPPLPRTRSLIVPYEEIAAAIETVPLLLRGSAVPLALEFIEREVIEVTAKRLNKRWPCSLGRTYLLIILDAPDEDRLDALSQDMAALCLERGGLEVFIAETPQQQAQVLEVRSKIYDAIKPQTLEILDISLPRSEIAGHVQTVGRVSLESGLWLPTFGHAGDGNIHTHIMKARFKDGDLEPLPEEAWKGKLEKVREALFKDAKARGGVISGEHGIGLVKKGYLPFILGAEQVELMRGIKSVFDPRGILNPGKMFDQPVQSDRLGQRSIP